jgi:hypothetical protein
MLRRLFWLGTGFGLGVAASHKARRTLGAGAGERAAAMLRDAVRAGRVEAREREAALREVFATPRIRNTGQ